MLGQVISDTANMKPTNYHEEESLGSPNIEVDAPRLDHVTLILPPKEDFRKLLESPSSISEADMEEERALFPDLQ